MTLPISGTSLSLRQWLMGLGLLPPVMVLRGQQAQGCREWGRDAPTLVPGGDPLRAMGQVRTLGMSQPCRDPAWHQRSPARSPFVSLARGAARVKGQAEMGGSRNRTRVERRKNKESC